MHDLAVEQEGDGGEPDMRMRPHIDAFAGVEHRGAEMIEKDKGSDHAPLGVRQRAADRKVAKIDAAWHDDEVDRVAGGGIAGEQGPCQGRSSWPNLG